MQRGKRRREDAAPHAPHAPPAADEAAHADEYAGWRPAAGDTVERVDGATLTPRAFFERFVAPRRPVVITGGLTDAGWRAPALWDDAYLRAAAGDAHVRVESRPHAGAAFGAGTYMALRFADFLDRCAGGEERLYLTTEATRFDAHGRLAVVCPPLTQLLADVPLQPALAGRLVPASLNLWCGRSAAGASSGLHHDWHDNLYALLRGRKRFALFAPSDTPRLYPSGVLTRIHANGRINYAGGAPSRADGADARDVARVASLDAQAAQAALDAAEADVLAGAPGAKKARRQAEAALEAALAEALQAEALAAGNGAGESGEDGSDEDDADDDEGGTWCGRDDYVDSDADAGSAGDGGESGSDGEGGAPPHFSTMDASRPQDFPLFADATCIHVDVAAGELLFLPCGWWHEVTSWSGDAATDKADKGHAGSAGAHLAVNFWFHPPDTDRFDAPYSDTLWERDFAAWKRDILPGLLATRTAADAGA